ncbi:MAG: hypothetical protein IPK22_19265 [Verrucomicrobiaceae bacterium]|nr:hypothetical protein [Verrucomicrobiaceae bacterium]
MSTSLFLRRPLELPEDFPTSRYDSLGLSDNPFPFEPSFNSRNLDNPRVNGQIYSDELHEAQATEFRNCLIGSPHRPKPRSLVFLMDLASRSGRGIGKSAFLNRQNARVMEDLGASMSDNTEVVFSVVITPDSSSTHKKFSDFCRLITRALVDDGIISLALARLRAMSGQIPEAKLDSITTMDELNVCLHDDAWIDQGAMCSQWDLPSRMTSRWLDNRLRQQGIPHQMVDVFSTSGTPELIRSRWFDELSSANWRKDGATILFEWLPKIFHLAAFSRGLLLIDEVEKIVTPMNQPELRAFADCMRQVLFDGNLFSARSGFYGMLLTIHPFIQELLAPHWDTAGLDRLAPLHDPAGRDCRIDFPALDVRMAEPLVRVYLDHYRARPPQSDLSPFNSESLVAAIEQSGRLPGHMLQLLHRVIERAAQSGIQVIDKTLVETVARGEAPQLEVQTFMDQLAPASVSLTETE